MRALFGAPSDTDSAVCVFAVIVLSPHGQLGRPRDASVFPARAFNIIFYAVSRDILIFTFSLSQ